MANSATGLLPIARRWSAVGLVAGPAVGVSLAVANIAVMAAGRANFLASPLHTLGVATAITLTVSSLVVQLAARLIRNQRHILARLDEVQTLCGYAEGYADGVSAAPVSPGISRLDRTRR